MNTSAAENTFEKTEKDRWKEKVERKSQQQNQEKKRKQKGEKILKNHT